MTVQNVSFNGIEMTRNGNLYKKKNTGKRIGTMVGLATGVTLAALPQTRLGIFALSARLFPKDPIKMVGSTFGLLLAGVAGITLAFRTLGSIPDGIINKKRIKKADHIS